MSTSQRPFVICFSATSIAPGRCASRHSWSREGNSAGRAGCYGLAIPFYLLRDLPALPSSQEESYRVLGQWRTDTPSPSRQRSSQNERAHVVDRVFGRGG